MAFRGPSAALAEYSKITKGSVLSVDMAIIGLGYVGLPLAQQAVRCKLQVRGLDLNERIVEALNRGRSHIDDLSHVEVAAMLEAGFSATTDEAILASADTVVICVPTPLSADGEPDLGAVVAATEAIGRNLRDGQLVVVESTTYPGTTDEIVRPILERSGLVAGIDFHLAFSPERVDPGNSKYGIENTPKVVGGHTDACTTRATQFYERFVSTVVRARGTREAEMTKLLENTYRHINIALVNEMAQFCHEMKIDLWDVIACAETKPFGFQAFYPGPGVGGHCIPIDPNYLSYKVRALLGYPFQFVELAQVINQQMPNYVAQRVAALLNDDMRSVNGARILLLGVTYKANIADQRESPVRPLAELLADQGAIIQYHDPYVERWSIATGELERVGDLRLALESADLTVLLQSHAAYDVGQISRKTRMLFDTRGASSRGPRQENVVRL